MLVISNIVHKYINLFKYDQLGVGRELLIFWNWKRSEISFTPSKRSSKKIEKKWHEIKDGNINWKHKKQKHDQKSQHAAELSVLSFLLDSSFLLVITLQNSTCGCVQLKSNIKDLSHCLFLTIKTCFFTLDQ